MTTYSCRANCVEPGGTFYLWFPRGTNMERPSCPDGWNVSVPSSYVIGDWHWQWAWQVHVDKKAKPGEYRVGDETIAVTKPAKIRALKRIAVSNSLSDCQKWLDKGYDLELAPGIHRWNKALRVPDGATISSAGAWIIRHPDGDYAERMFIPQGSLILDGLVLTHAAEIESAKIVYLHEYPAKPGKITVRNCVIRGGNLAQSMPPGMIVEHCLFERASTGQIASQSAWLHCRFTGRTAIGHHPWFNTGAEGVLAVDCVWDGTNRGQVHQSGACRGGMNLDLTFSRIRGGEANAGECILLEGGTVDAVDSGSGMRDNTWVDVSITDCTGPGVMLFGTGMNRNVFWNVDSYVDNTSLSVIAFPHGRVDDNEFHNWQCTGGLTLHGDVGRVQLENFTLIETPQRTGNQGRHPEMIRYFSSRYPFDLDTVARSQGAFSLSGVGILTVDGQYDEIRKLTSLQER